VGDAAVPVAEMCERLIAMANGRGGIDNVTCVVMRFSERVSESAG
jgi:serine/threonine protein phosphatase PrpC